ncbi:MAG: hypothetical protein ACFFD1_00845 [Candidatus Thorarchaeota archaeon]
MTGEMIDYLKYPEATAPVETIYQRFKKGLGTTVFVIGLPGTGKSSTCIRMGELITEKIHGKVRITEDNIADSLLKVVKFIRDVKIPGEVLIIEEIAVLFPSTRAMSKDNVAIGKIMDTIRKKQVILITNAPVLKHIDSHMRALGNMLIETQKIVKTHSIVVSKVFRLQTNPQSGKTYFHKLMRDGKDIDLIYTKKPGEEIWNKYEDDKDSFLGKLYEKLENEHLIKMDEEQAKLEKRKYKIKLKNQELEIEDLTPREKELYHLMVNRKLRVTEAAKIMGVVHTAAGHLKKKIEQKMGIILAPPR